MGKKDALLIAAIIGGVIFLPGLLQQKEDGSPPMTLNMFPGDSPGLDLSGLLGGSGGGGLLGDMDTGVGGLWDYLTTAVQGMNQQLNDALDTIKQSIQIPTSPGDNGGGTSDPGKPDPGKPDGGRQSMPNTIPNIIYSFADAAQSLTSLAIAGGATYVGVRALGAAAPSIGRGVGSVASQVLPKAGAAAGKSMSVAGQALTQIGKIAVSPVSRLGLAGSLAAIPLAAAAGYGGWKLGEMFNQSRPGQALQSAAGQAGASFSKSTIGKAVFPRAELNQPKVDAVFSKYGLSISTVKSMLASGMSPAAIIQNSKTRQQASKNIVGVGFGVNVGGSK